MHLASILKIFPILHFLEISRTTRAQMDGEGFKRGLESPLIPRDENGVGFGGESTKKCCDKSEARAELKQQMKLVGPLVMVSLLQHSLQMISIMFVGHLGELSLSSASIATSFAEVIGFSFMA